LFHDQAEKRVKVGLVVNEVIRSLDMQVDEQRLDERLAEMAAQYGEPEQVINWYKSNPDQLQQIEMGILEDQVVDHIVGSAEIEVVEASYEDVVSGTAIAPEGAQDSASEDAESASAEADENATDASSAPEGSAGDDTTVTDTDERQSS